MSKEITETIPTNSFLPIGYKMPDKSKQFMKLKQGDNPIRILSSPLLGYVVFSHEKKPIRRPFSLGDFLPEELTEIKPKIDPETNKPEPSKHFWLMLVWDYADNAPKVLEITQITILKPLNLLCENTNWGDLRQFDITINKVGATKNDTEFTVIPNPPSPLKNEIKNMIEELHEKDLLNLEAIWEGEYPFLTYNF
ncbi:hypothetical protein D1632_10635 [Chryseobacterium nematophagum]|uniref:Uncharacterized protein n=1 Tax=Chryseobacterium nematophagum TaxID=2305228 RepID=A0A3M7LCT2_9FLAO|nr:hypothetical protein [Chryseobacterium nematophagum]RMZ60039.1 hypothetical protein D1632_10635 [Chryseobacterium nematophagum]